MHIIRRSPSGLCGDDISLKDHLEDAKARLGQRYREQYDMYAPPQLLILNSLQSHNHPPPSRLKKSSSQPGTNNELGLWSMN